MEYKHIIEVKDVDRIADWIASRGGIKVWKSVNLSNPGAGWTTPATDEDGQPTGKPTWQAANEPEHVITDPAEVGVVSGEEAKRFRVAVRPGSQGFSMKLTDHSSERVEREMERAEGGAWYEFDYENQECVIYRQTDLVSLFDRVADRTTAAKL